jgi:multidrug resistance efflux pump
MVYLFSFLVPITDNAFVVANIRPVAANVSGYVTALYVKNEQAVKQGQPLFTVFPTPYELTYKNAIAKVEEAKAAYIALQQQLELNRNLLQASADTYQKLALNYKRYANAYKDNAVPEIAVEDLLKDKNAALAKFKAAQEQVKLAKQNLVVQQKKIEALALSAANAKVDLDETTVYAATDGIVQNMFLSLRTPVVIHQPLFSFVDTTDLYIQANFNETDLRLVRVGDKVKIFPRMYLGQKIFHGTVVSNNWAAERQQTQERSQLQKVTSENEWLLLPQRFPVQIKVLDPDSHYPLNIGASAYVYIEGR